MSEMHAAMDTIAFYNRPQYRFFMVAAARLLKQRNAGRLIMYCSTRQEEKFYEEYSRGQPFDEVIIARSLYADIEKPLDEEDVLRRATQLEGKLGITLNKLMVPDRHYGRGYMLGGFHHPTSRYSDRTYTEAVAAFCAVLTFWENEIKHQNIKLIVNAPRQAAQMARYFAIPYRTLAASRFENYHYWAWSELYECPRFQPTWEAMQGNPDAVPDAPYYGHIVSRNRMRHSMTLRATLKSLFMHTARVSYWKLRGYEKGRGYHYLDSLRFIWRIYTENRKLKKTATTRLSDLKGKRFVYMPLHIEPEFALQGLSPEYFYQHAMIAAISRDLPAGVYLAVKEHFGAVGRRPADFYDQIKALKNVVLLEMWESGFECCRQADVVATICGTSGLEGLINGNPVISFGRNNIYNFLPGVQVVRDEVELPAMLRKALNGDVTEDDIRSGAARFVAAVRACSFDMSKYDHFDVANYDSGSVSGAVDALLDSIQGDPNAAVKQDSVA